MSARVFCAARRSLCSSRYLLSLRTRADYSHSSLSPIAYCLQEPEASTSAVPKEQTRTPTRSDTHTVATNAKNPLDPTRFDRYLSSIRAADLEPTLDDIEQCKPQSFSRPDSSHYAAEYTNLLETLCRSFSKDQLRRFTELYKLDSIWTRSSRRKTEYAESIIEKAWGWPSLKEIERKRRDTTEVLLKSFTVSPSQLFLILGKDGADLLQLSMQYNVHISSTSTPLALCVKGLRGSLKGVTEYISSLKKGIIEKIYELPSGRPVRPDLLQRISRLSGAYVENHGNRGKVRICAKNFGDISAAEKLLLSASLEIGTQKRTVCYDPPSKTRNSPIDISEPQKYAIYPFITPYSFPWTMDSGGGFRLRRVADWLGVDCYENIAFTGGLTDNPHRLLNLNRGVEELNQLICSALPESTSSHQRTVTASLGHILISSGDNSQRGSIFPPLTITSSLPEVLEWVETSRAPLTFVPSVPPAMTPTTIDGQRKLHRLIYRTLPQITDHAAKSLLHVLRFELELSCLPLISTPTQLNLPKLNDIMLSCEPTSGESSHSSPDSPSQPGSLSDALNNAWHASCQVGREAYINLMLPDRPIDMQLCISDLDSICLTQQPQVLREYAAKLRDFLANVTQLAQPDPPSTFNHEGRTYYLHESLNLRRGNVDSLPTVPNDCSVDDKVNAVTESIEDLQSDQKMELFQVIHDGTTEGPSWRRFLAACDQVTVAPLESRSKDQTVI